MRSLRRSLLLLAVALLVRPATAAALQAAPAVQEPVDLDVIERIRDEGLNRSQIPELARHLTDVIGPRLTGSTGMRRANEWTAETLRGWGLANVVIEPWGEFGRGWENVRYAGRTLEPYVQPLSAHPIAWTGSTRGTATGPVVIVHADSVADLEPHRGKLRGAFVMTEAPEAREPEFEAAARRFTPEELLEAPEARDRPSPDQSAIRIVRRGSRPSDFRIRIASIITIDPAALSVAPVPLCHESRCAPIITYSSARSVPGSPSVL